MAQRKIASTSKRPAPVVRADELIGEKLRLPAQRAKLQWEQRIPSRDPEPPTGKDYLQVGSICTRKPRAEARKTSPSVWQTGNIPIFLFQ
jgi:hypothetical protein